MEEKNTYEKKPKDREGDIKSPLFIAQMHRALSADEQSFQKGTLFLNAIRALMEWDASMLQVAK